MKLSIIPKAAPAWFPYPEHRSMAEVMAFENNVRGAVENAIAEALLPGLHGIRATPASASTLSAGSDRTAFHGGHG